MFKRSTYQLLKGIYRLDAKRPLLLFQNPSISRELQKYRNCGEHNWSKKAPSYQADSVNRQFKLSAASKKVSEESRWGFGFPFSTIENILSKLFHMDFLKDNKCTSFTAKVTLNKLTFLNLVCETYRPIPVPNARSFIMMNVYFTSQDLQILNTLVLGAQKSQERFKTINDT